MNPLLGIPELQRKMLPLMQWSVILIGLSVPISTALDNILLALVMLGALVSLGGIMRTGMTNMVSRAALLLFAALFAAMFYGATPLKEAFAILAKYVDLLFIPIFIFVLSNETVRRKARQAFLVAMAITLGLSFLVGLELLPVMSWMSAYTQTWNPVIFHSHITQSNMMAFATLLALLEWREAGTSSRRFAWGLFALLAAFNVLFLVQGRTGYLVLLGLSGWFAWTSMARYMHKRGSDWGWRQGVLILLAIITATLAAYHGSTRLHERVTQMMSEYQEWQPDHGKLTSVGQRLDFYSNTIEIVREHPLGGVGTGGFPAAFEQQTQGKDILKTNNPHNEYLLISVQAGIVGLSLLLYLFYTQWRCAPKLPSSFEQDAARGLVLMYVVNCMFNSALHDHADGLFFAFMTAVLFAGLKQEKQHG